MSSFVTFSAYLASLGPQAPSQPISPDSSSNSSAEGSPSKRAREHSPDTSISSTSPPDNTYFKQHDNVAPTPDTASDATITLAAPTPTLPATCVVRSILCATFSDIYSPSTSSSHDPSAVSSPGTSSPPISRPLSRRSSTGCSTKSVRFARCTNASVFPALSVEEYDRSPIIPTTESESLELPKRKRGEAEGGWIKCVERERAAAAKRGLDKVKSTACGPRPSLTISSLENPVEGVHGLIEGGYFVGEERDHDESFDETEELDHDGMVVDDEETGGHGGGASETIQDDSSGDEDHHSDSRDYHGALFVSSPTSEADPNQQQQRGLGIQRIDVEDSDDDEEDEETRTRREKEEERARSRAKCRERYGLCALGKYTRQEVFQSYDSLGGF
ncbi:hypothetical protein BCR35DRAFT_23854 [Leucosporidium creatinivorum]|uniref:Uncharacterized protein n=1 Tax=Leucosporidium creatinivorum TaxID=106004 RepID=A0A1Y2FWA5_9BASI|nr:hypothetical protein BCR35DRAFT_23854 [Leucosporidium creatinivorum]